ncbi:MAG: FliO/MopB family protein [Opitutaceae bacterium]
MTSRVRSTFATVLALALSFTARAADESEVIFPGGGSPPGTPATTAGGGLNTLSLGVGLVLAAVGAWFLWRNRRRVSAGNDIRALAIDETRSLGNRQYLVVASHQGKRFLLGVCPGQISFLSALPDATDREGAGK